MPRPRFASFIALMALVLCTSWVIAAESQWAYRGVSGRLLYAPDAQGDRLPDFSDVGYRSGKVALPDVPSILTVQPIAGDNTSHIQAAIDQVSALSLDANGFRGAVTLAPGDYEIGGQLLINTSGVVLRGSGRDAGGTKLIATGTSQRDLIQIAGTGSQSLTGSTRNMIDKTVPVGARSFRVNSTSGFAVGNTVRVERPSTANWISDLGMDMIPPRSDGGTVNQWQAGSFNLRYDRVITRIEGNRIFVDAPLTNAFELQYGGGTIKKYNWGGRIENVGIENLRAESTFTSATDENHSWNFVTIDKAQNVWVRDTASAYFARSAVLSHPGAKWVTVDNAINESPKSQITGGRRYTFDLSGQLELVTNSQANEGRHDFVNNSTRPAGPHVFHNSVANNALDESGPHQRWATGTLFDNITIDGDQINARNRGNFGSGHGWAGANMVIWNSTADSFIVQNPPTAQNWLIGSTGTIIDDQTFGPQPAGYVDSHGTRADVDSLYEAQVSDASNVTTFNWSGETAAWIDPEAWDERLTPGAYQIENRDYLIGDIDDFTQDGSGSVDEAFIDPSWEAQILGSSALPITGFDDTSGNKNIAFTVQHQLDAGERVIHGSLALSLKQSGGVVSSDFVRLFDTASNHKLLFSDLGWDSQVNASEAFVGVLDLGDFTENLQSGSMNVQVNDDTAVDWALYTITVASSLGTTNLTSVAISSGGEAIISSDVGSVADLSLGAGSPGELSLGAEGQVTVHDLFSQKSLGVLRVTIANSGAGQLLVEGDAAIDGELEIVSPNYNATFGDAFSLLTVDGLLSGQFATTTLPVLGGGLSWKVLQTSSAVTALVVLTGDYNGDGFVDAADYTVWRDNFGSTSLLDADGNNDGTVDQADYDVWVTAFGAIASSSAGASAPEPSSLVLLSALSPLIMAHRNHRIATPI